MDFIEHYERRCFRFGAWCLLWSVAAIVLLALTIIAIKQGWIVGHEKLRLSRVFAAAAMVSFLFALLSFSFWREARKRLDRYLEDNYY